MITLEGQSLLFFHLWRAWMQVRLFAPAPCCAPPPRPRHVCVCECWVSPADSAALEANSSNRGSVFALWTGTLDLIMVL